MRRHWFGRLGLFVLAGLVYVLVLQPREVGYVATQTARAGASGYQIDLRHFRKAGTSSTAVYALATRGSTRLMVRVDATHRGPERRGGHAARRRGALGARHRDLTATRDHPGAP